MKHFFIYKTEKPPVLILHLFDEDLATARWGDAEHSGRQNWDRIIASGYQIQLVLSERRSYKIIHITSSNSRAEAGMTLAGINFQHKYQDELLLSLAVNRTARVWLGEQKIRVTQKNIPSIH
ncbi:hypothetical protein [Comamonas testosteroni]|uniref:hypothetical protein n=1 Tax=Comamonas testosteroni TaxID=285 RepID=UPI0012D3546B|nr:hypothetical protein [Comamonas testosteroni]